MQAKRDSPKTLESTTPTGFGLVSSKCDFTGRNGTDSYSGYRSNQRDQEN